MCESVSRSYILIAALLCISKRSQEVSSKVKRLTRHRTQCCVTGSMFADVPSQNEPLLSCKIQSSRYRKAFISHSQMLEINEDPEQLQCRHEVRDMVVAMV